MEISIGPWLKVLLIEWVGRVLRYVTSLFTVYRAQWRHERKPRKNFTNCFKYEN